MTAPPSTSFSESNMCPEFRAVSDASARLVILIVGVVVALTFYTGPAMSAVDGASGPSRVQEG